MCPWTANHLYIHLARRQFALGFWWDSTTLTRELDGVSLAEHTVEVDRASSRPAPRERARA